MSRLRPLSQITELFIHCAATPNGEWFEAKDIDRWHKERNFNRHPSLIGHQQPSLKHIGYHFVIGINGGVISGRSLTETGAHALDPNFKKGDPRRYQHNRNAIATCVIGTDKFTPAQWLSLKQHVIALKNRFPNLKIIGHRDISPDTNHNGKVDPHEWIKLCPGFDVQNWLDNDMEAPQAHTLPTSAE